MYLHESHLLKISDWCGPNFFKLATSVYLDSHDALISCLFKIWVSCLLAGMSLLKRRGTKNATSPNNFQIVLFHQNFLKHVFIIPKKKKSLTSKSYNILFFKTLYPTNFKPPL